MGLIRFLQFLSVSSLFFSGATVPSVWGASSTEEWQTVGLEEKIYERVTKAIKPSMSGREFMVSIKLVVKPLPEVPAAKPTPAKTVNPKAEPKNDEKDKDLLMLSKLDFSVPNLPVQESPASEAREIGILGRIEKLDARVVIDAEIPEDRRQVIEEIVRATLDPFLAFAKQIKPTVRVDAITFSLPEKAKEPEKWDTKRWLSEFKIPIGVVFSALILGLILLIPFYLAIRAYQNFELRRIAVLEAQNAREDTRVQAETKSREQELSVPLTETNKNTEELEEPEGAMRGFERFKLVFEKSPEGAAALIKQWIKAPVRGAGDALFFLPKIIGVEEFTQLLSYLSVDERREWKKVLAQSIPLSHRASAEAYVSSQIVEGLLMPAPEVPREIQDSLTSLKTAQLAEIASTDSQLGAAMVSLLPTTQIAQMLAIMEPDAANAVTMASLKMTASEAATRASALKEAAQQAILNRKASSSEFLDRAAELLAEVAPDKEASIFIAMVESKNFELLQSATRQFFPAELIAKLPPAVLQVCLERMPLARRADLIQSRGEEKSVFLTAIGSEGSKVREMVQIELDQINTDDLRKRRIEKTRDILWREFVALVRAMIRANENLALQADSVLEPWLSEKSGGQIGKAAVA